MATPVGQLTIEMAANIVRLQKDMDGARKTVDGAMSSITKSVDAGMRTVATLFAGISIATFANKLISVQREFDVLNSSLITVTGSSAEAEKAFALLEDFASTTPFSLAEVTRAFTKLKAMGLDPSAEALRSYGNTASAMGKSLNQMIEAIADAATGEFERLKEFGIKAKSEGDRVTFTFKGLSTTIGKNSAEIEAYLRRIGDVDFAGATELRAKTLDGALSNLGDTYDKLFRTIASGDIGGVISDGVRLAINSLELLIKIVQATNVSMVGAAKDSSAFGVIMDGIAVIFETVAVVGINVKYVITQIINEIVGLSRQVAAIASGNFSEVGKISDQMIAEAETARQQVDMTTKAILSARKSQSMSYTETENDLKRLGNRWVATGSAASDAYAKELASANKTKPVVTKLTADQIKEMEKQETAYKKLLNDIEDKTGAMLLEQSQTEKLTDSQKLALKVMQDIQTGTLKLNDSQKIRITQSLEELLKTEQINAEMKELAKTKAAAITLSEKLNAEQDKQTESIRESVIRLMEQNEELRDGKVAVLARQIAVMRSTATDLEFQAANEGGNRALEEQARLLRQQADLAQDNSLLTAAKEAEEAFKKTSESIAESLTDALMRGFESGKDFGKNLMASLVNMFKTLVLRPIIQPIAQGGANFILSMMGMGAAGSATAGTGMTIAGINFAAQGTALADGFMSGISGMFSGGAPVTSLGGATSTAFNAGSSAAAAMPYVAAALVALNALGAFRSEKVVGGGLTGTLGEGDISSYDLQRKGGTLFQGPDYSIINMQTSEMSRNLQTAFLGMRDSASAMGQMLGLSTTAVSTFTMAIGDVQVHPDIATLGLVLDGLTEEGKAAKIEAALAAANEGMAKLVLGATDLQLVGETAYQTLTRLADIQSISESLNLFGGAFTTFATASVTARQSIIELAGGLEALILKTQGFVANFYSKEEQAGITARGIVTALEAAGFTAAQIAALETRADFRTLLENIDVGTLIGQQQFVALLDLQAAYSATVPIMEEQTATLLEIAEAAPQIAILQKMFETDAAYQTRLTEAETAAAIVFNDLKALSTTQNTSLIAIAEKALQLDVLQKINENDAEYAIRRAAAEAAAKEQIDGLRKTMGDVDISINTLTTIMASRLDRLAVEMAQAQAASNAAAASAIAMANASAAAAIQAANTASTLATLAYTDIEQSAMGGFINGPTLVGEHGPELFDPRTSQVFTAPATSNIFGGNEVAGEIRALRDEVAMMRYETRSTAVNTAKIFRLQDNWDVRGLVVRTDADQPLDTVTV